MTRPIHSADIGTRATRMLVLSIALVAPRAAGAVPSRLALGKPLFDQACGRCHQVGIGAGNGIGPQLNGIIGAPAGIVPGYEYSTADTRSAVVWTRQAFDAFIENPRAAMPGTRMKGPGIASKAERDAIFAYVAGFKADGTIGAR